LTVYINPVATRWPLPLPPRPSSLPTGTSGSSRSTRPRAHPPRLRLPFKENLVVLDPRRSHLSWDSFEVCPSADDQIRRPLPAVPSKRRCLRPVAATRQVAFRPRGFAPPRRFAPAHPCGLVASRCQPGVRCVSPATRPGPAEAEPARRPRDPRNAVHTPRRIPLVCSRTASPRPLPSCRYPSQTWVFALEPRPHPKARPPVASMADRAASCPPPRCRGPSGAEALAVSRPAR